MNTIQKTLAALLSVILAAALFTGCGATTTASSEPAASTASSEATSEAVSTAEAAGIAVTFNITDKDGNVSPVALDATADETLADALLDAGLISAEEHDAGFVTVVNGIAADYNADKAWWALVDANGEMTAVGISDIKLADGDTYGFVYTVG